ncbi:MAG: 5-methylcytosine restriction system specificity protein McrC [Parahaliea sp.]
MNPNFQRGKHMGISLMFPMEKLFESHVAVCLKSKMKTATRSIAWPSLPNSWAATATL